MLDELIDAIGIEYMEDKLKNDIKLNNTLCIRVNKDNSLDTLLIEKDECMDNLELKKWFKQRLNYSENINSNKCVCQSGIAPKLITSSVRYAVIFNMATMASKLTNENGINSFLNLAINQYLEKLQVDCSLVLNSLEYIVPVLNDNIDKKVKVIIFENEDDELYIEEYNKYILNNVFDKGSNVYSGFISLNSKKPLLSNIGSCISVIQEYTDNEVLRIFTLNKYLSKFAKTKNVYKTQGGEMELIYNPKDKIIIDYEYIPYSELDELVKNPIYIDDIIGTNKESIKLSSYSRLIDEINKLFNFALGSEDKGDNRKQRIYHKYKKTIKHFETVDNKRRYIVDKQFINHNIEKILNDMLNYNCDKVAENNYNIKNALNLSICIKDYFNKDGGKMYIKEIQEILFNKLKNYKDGFELDDEKQVAFMSGQLASYLTSKNKASIRSNELTSKYNKSKNWKKIIKHLILDFDKYGYDISKDSRENIVFSEIIDKSSHYNGMDENIRLMFLKGLYSSNIFYKATKNKENNKGEIKNEK